MLYDMNMYYRYVVQYGVLHAHHVMHMEENSHHKYTLCCLISIIIPFIKLRLSRHHHRIFYNGNTIPGKTGIYILIRGSGPMH